MITLILYLSGLLTPPPDSPHASISPNLIYKTTQDESLSLDLYTPINTPGPWPVVVYVHGGVWVLGERAADPDLKQRLAQRGIATAAIDFSRWADDGFRAQVQDIKDAVRWLRAHAGELGLDPGRFGMFGSSSGGHLAGLAGFAGDGEGFGDDPPGTSSEVQALFLLYGLYDLTGNRSYNFLAHYFGGNARFDQGTNLLELFSPIYHIDGSEPPTQLLHGMEDNIIPIEQAENLAAALTTAGVTAHVLKAQGEPHGFAKTHKESRPLVYELITGFFESKLLP